MIEEYAQPNLDAGRLRSIELEREKIAESKDGEQVIGCMRKTMEIANRPVILEKALSMQTEVMPLILKRFMTSGHDVFIENAAIVFAYSEMKYVEQLYDVFEKIRNPYARSISCVVFGFRERKDYLPLIYKQFLLFRKEFADESYEQGPLLALNLFRED